VQYLNKIVLITGASRGVGSELRDYFLNKGANVIGVSRSGDQHVHDNYTAYSADLASPNNIVRLFLEIRKNFDRIDIVINNAAVLTSQYAMIMPPAAAQAMVNINLLAPFMVSREAAKLMRKSKWGRIINIGSMAASLEPVGDSVYAACKSGLSTLANVMAKEFSSMNVTCNTLGINAIKSDMLAQLPEETIDAIIESLPVPRYSTIEDVTNVVDFFASENSSTITAQTIFLGGVN
jgi:3-oxoacyl-[acyl-carrier protein] reductase